MQQKNKEDNTNDSNRKQKKTRGWGGGVKLTVVTGVVFRPPLSPSLPSFLLEFAVVS